MESGIQEKKKKKEKAKRKRQALTSRPRTFLSHEKMDTSSARQRDSLARAQTLFSKSPVAGDVAALRPAQNLALFLLLKSGRKGNTPRWGMGHTRGTPEGINGKGRTKTVGLVYGSAQ